MMNETTLAARRIHAAEASGGASSDVMYSTVTQILHELKLGGDLLDFGAGKGFFTSELARLERFRSVTGADIVWRPDGLPSGIDNWIAGDLNAPLGVPESSFDVIVAVEVIEHLENPRATAREWFRLLREGGTIICSTPNNESWRSPLALLLRGRSQANRSTGSQSPKHVQFSCSAVNDPGEPGTLGVLAKWRPLLRYLYGPLHPQC
jgi:2-polyprenyl-3-methyl-5-hydroxy-6-metoxy-1,4-benzoquinol methylase